MGMRVEGMERWGAVAILMESGTLLSKHYRLFLPFFLTLYIPTALYGLLQTELLGPSAAPLHFVTFIQTTFTQGREQGTDRLTAFDVRELVPTLVSTILWILMYVLGTVGLGAIVYTMAYIYSNNDDSTSVNKTDDRSTIVNNLFKSLPHAFVRMVVTQLWTVLAILVLYMVPVLLYSVTGANLDSPWLLFFGLGAFIGTFLLIILFAFAPFIAVLEPANYGRQALKRSSQLVRIGGEGTVVALFLISTVFTVLLMVPTQVIATTTLPVWEEIALGAFIAILNSVSSVYFGVVSVVMFFVYTSRFDAVSSSAIPAFSAENPYKPLVSAGKVYSYI